MLFVRFRWAWQSMCVYFCWLQRSWVCHLILKTMPSCPGLIPMLHSTIGLTAGSAEHSPLHQWKAFRGGHLHFKEKTFSKSANTFNSNHMWCLFFIWWRLTTLKWTGATLCTLTLDITWLLILIIHCLGLMTVLPYICNCKTGFVSNPLKAFKLQMIVRAPRSGTASSNYSRGPLDQRPAIWGLGEYVDSTI